VVEGQAGRPDWANIGPLGDCLPWVNSFWKLHQNILGPIFTWYKLCFKFDK
jgi:hypothetical protein